MPWGAEPPPVPDPDMAELPTWLADQTLRVGMAMARMGFFHLRADLQVHWASPDLYRLLGISDQDPDKAAKWYRGIPAEDWEIALAGYNAARRVGGLVAYGWRWHSPEGEVFHFSTRAQGVADPDGHFWGWVGCTQEITQAEEQARNLRKTTAMLSRALRVGRMGAWRYEVPGGPGWWSEGMAEVMGLPADTPPWSSDITFSMLKPEDQVRWQRTLQDAMARKAPFHFHWRFAPPGQEERSLLTVGEMEEMADGQIGASWGVTQDISPMQSALSALHESEAKFRALLDTALDTILLFDASGACLFHNPRALELFALDAKALSGAALVDLLPAVAQALNSTRSGQLSLMEAEAKRANGPAVPVEVAASAWASGGQSYLTCVVRDLRERREVDRLKGEFLSTVSHELRTPLNMVCGALDLLSSGLLPETKRARMFEIANHNLDRLLRLVNDVLDLQAAEAGKLRMLLRAVDYDAIAHGAVAAAAPAAEAAKVRLEVKGTLGAGVADGDRLHQVLLNLLGNACRFAPPASVVSLILEREGDWVRFSVVDRGPGVPQAQAELIFERFIQLQVPGSQNVGGAGLGLAISRTLMAQHQGELTCERTPGGGATFVARMPREPQGSSSAADASLTIG